ncbi:dihydrofolate reductase family protein [Micromonospora parathelypteridis]|uniref:Dihydrofolate reductase n=1 Tax=Micromonospora parathelypteridis TaxID=1839617 RepID=A0A840VT17_9ACTN|nr:dihydrofolate reductase family protein [Micromonospora parathelypteridis]MBB5476158.1 dihydrofolate reductase [Micromonospora parathelypteridis]GGO13658.1 deaminase reductase [Micromonospora parathelypteridis]
MLLSVNVFVSLDGIMQGPGAPDEDRSGGFDRGGWLVPHASVHTNEVVEGWFREADAFLFGRTSYGLLGGYWTKVTAPGDLIATKLNTLPKYVVSKTLTDQEADWSPTTVLRTDIVDDVRRLKELPGKELQVHGSWKLVQALHQAGLVDLYRLLQYPVVVGTGKRLFPDGSTFATFAASDGSARELPGGVVSLTLTPTTLGVISAGAYTVERGRSTTVLD